MSARPHVVVIGGGFTGLSAAMELARAGAGVTVLERDGGLGGLAGSFDVGGTRLEKFYHHWFTNDRHVHDLVADLKAEDRIVYRPTRTGSWYANRLFRLSRPLDVLRYTPLSPVGRLRLGGLVVQARMVRDWRQLERLTAREWLISMCGREVFDKVWGPLLKGKFGAHAGDISAVWIWNKLKLRGGSRGKGGEEQLAYFRGGFAALADLMARDIAAHGGGVLTDTEVRGLISEGGRVRGVRLQGEDLHADAVLVTTPLPVFARLGQGHLPEDYLRSLGRIDYLGNVCLTLELDRSLSGTYWLNVTDPDFPFVGVIEHTNFEPTESYDGRHIVYLSKYVPTDDPLYGMEGHEFLAFALPYLKRMFPAFSRDWVKAAHLHRAAHAQPIVTRGYGALIPPEDTPLGGLYLSTMAQIYPEDRGTNYAIERGRAIGRRLAEVLRGASAAPESRYLKTGS
ncbi:MAG: NAD(P)/FAD-dependent oxidoreductase [Alphaproteobacteria bacterium]